MIDTMKKVTVYWTEFHNYSQDIEIPDNLSNEEELDWVMNNTDEWGMGLGSPDDINTDWDGFYIEGRE
jgi:hypothetical protein